MGLDMYLTAKKYFFDEDTPEYQKLQEMMNSELKVESIEFKVGYWRKANAIHKWFVTNVQSDEDNCDTYYVTAENLQKLLDDVNKALESSNPSEVLPTNSGFFFGSTEYDEVYRKDLTYTKEILEKFLNSKEKNMDVFYHSSW